jgi:hypothetical protein
MIALFVHGDFLVPSSTTKIFDEREPLKHYKIK